MITVDLGKAKEIAHSKRREVREELFKPLDVQATIPMFVQAAEAQRQEIRTEFAEIQTAIDSASTVAELRGALCRCTER